MRKLFLVILIIVGVGLTSCSKDDGGVGPIGENSKLIVGIWQMVEESLFDESSSLLEKNDLRVSADCPYNVLEFKKDNATDFTYFVNDSVMDVQCEKRFVENSSYWSFTNERRLTILVDGSKIYYTVVNLDADELILDRLLSKEDAVLGGYSDEVRRIQIRYVR